MSCDCESKRKLAEYEIKLERLLYKLRDYEKDQSEYTILINQIKNNEIAVIKNLIEKLDILQTSNLCDETIMPNLIDILLSALSCLTLDRTLPSNLNDLAVKFQKKSHQDNQNNNLEQKLLEKLQIAEKEIFTLKKKLKQTKFELDSLKLKLNNPHLMTQSSTGSSLSPSTNSHTELVDIKKIINNSKDKVDKQNIMIKSLLKALSIEFNDEISKSKVVASCSPTPITSTFSTDSSSSSSSSSCNKSSSNELSSPNMFDKQPMANQITTPTLKNEIYLCPKCNTSFDSTRITSKRYEMHLNECDSVNKLVCVFCSKLFDKKEQKPYELHIQNHLSKTSLTKSPTTTVSSTDYFFISNFENKLSSGSSTSSSNSTILSNSTSSLASNKIAQKNQATIQSTTNSSTPSFGNINNPKPHEKSKINFCDNEEETNEYLNLNQQESTADSNKNILISEFHPRTRKRL